MSAEGSDGVDSLLPWLQQAIVEFHLASDASEVGFYAGMSRFLHLVPAPPDVRAVQSVFFATEAVFVLRWCRLSDRYATLGTLEGCRLVQNRTQDGSVHRRGRLGPLDCLLRLLKDTLHHDREPCFTWGPERRYGSAWFGSPSVD
jgi:hypothetical protein